MDHTDITYKVLEVFAFTSVTSDKISKETVVENFFRQYDVQNPKHLETLDFIIEQIGGINETIKLFNLLLMACYTFQDDVVNILLEKGADPDHHVLGVSPLLFLMGNRKIHTMYDSEIKEMKKKMLLSLLRYGLSLTVKINGYTNIVEHAKSRGNLYLLQSIEQHTHILNESQKKEWETLKLQMLFC